MSPRQDSYLSLCLEQASKSPLHYRHGCVIVRGGKVIGRGFNHYRPGFNGGALKNGRTKESGSVETQKMKQKQKQHQSCGKDGIPSSLGGGSDANLALSMHSEMMAIRSALSLSSHPSGGSARATLWYETPCFKLSGRGKREHLLRKQNIRQFVERVCKAAEKSGGKIDTDDFTTQANMWRFESGTCGFNQCQQRCSQPAYSEPQDESDKGAEREEGGSGWFTSRENWSESV